MLKALYLGLLAALAAAPAGADDNKINIHRAFPPGVYVMTAVSQTEGVTEVGGQKLENRGDERLVWRVTAAKSEGQDEKKLTLRLTDVATRGRRQSSAL